MLWSNAEVPATAAEVAAGVPGAAAAWGLSQVGAGPVAISAGLAVKVGPMSVPPGWSPLPSAADAKVATIIGSWRPGPPSGPVNGRACCRAYHLHGRERLRPAETSAADMDHGSG
ncbi:hypothetical protein [Mycobacterium ostraviense]|uniref:Uncharacterized protein n=1 Tax=Mycobacterium ostraviense TaxID=2738409 RepID=A0A163WL72_9MYCO|nr:hypothetical protein [Mycobacterium ostraviense]KZS58447.1 hypothetical protein A4G28_26190 [Mycobacterium ostraviense]UGT93806.1 hypothetical protein LTS72_11620 [Mycobacterium ostraviense]